MSKFPHFVLATLFSLFSLSSVAAEKVYDLTIREEVVTKAGSTLKSALTINGQIPAPQLEFTVGDTAVIRVKNETKEITSLHWHGILLPSNQDGPMFSNNPPIEPGQTYTFRFDLTHAGTFWYHSHTELQEQRGLYGAIVIKGPHYHHKYKFAAEHSLVLSDWTHESPKEIMRNIKLNGHYYSFKKGTLTSWYGALRHGAVWDYIKGQWSRMGAMDLSDVAYDAFLINGEQTSMDASHFMPGDKIRLRLINAGASSYFYVNIGNARPFNVISKDGEDVVPVQVQELLMGMGETYDIVFTVPDEGMKSFEVRATAQDVTGMASFFIGHGAQEKVPNKMKPNPYKMGHGGHGEMPGDGNDGGDGGDGHDGDHGGGGGGHDGHGSVNSSMDPNMEMNPSMAGGEHDGHDMPGDDDDMVMVKRLSYDMLKSARPTAFASTLPRYDVVLELDGDMERYTWTINGKTMTEDKFIEINQGDVVRFTMVNKTMMHHPMHLHGHFFRLLNAQGANAPLAHTVDVGPMKTQTIEFYANNPGVWFFHCHNLYHMKMGMARLIKYRGHMQSDELKKSEMKWGPTLMNADTWFWGGEVGVYSNFSEVQFRGTGGRYEVELKMEMLDYDPETFEAEAVFKRYMNKYFAILAGAEYHDENLAAIAGFEWTMPMQVEMQAYTTTSGEVVVKLSKEIPITGRLHFDPAAQVRFSENFSKTETELEAFLRYQLNERWETGVYYRYEVEDNSHSVGVGFGWKF